MTQKTSRFRVVDYPFISMLMVVRKSQENIVSKAPIKMSIVQWRILGALGEESWIAMTKLADRTFVERTALHHMLNKLDEDGYVRRRQSKQDKRSIEVSLTQKGRRLYRKCADIAQAELGKALAGIPKSELKNLSRTLDKIKTNLDVIGW